MPRGHGPFPLLFVIHGGFWRNRYDLSHISHLCSSLTGTGIVTCNLEYRRIGDAGGGWPGTFQDLVQGTDRIVEMLSSEESVDAARTAVLGHSAGGHLALWLSSRGKVSKTSELSDTSPPKITRVISLAGVCDLRQAWRENLGNDAVTKLIGGSPHEHPERYQAANPIELLPSHSSQALVHGNADDVVPVSQSEKFAARARAMGEHPELIRLENTGHFELIDPESDAWSTVERSVMSMLEIQVKE